MSMTNVTFDRVINNLAEATDKDGRRLKMESVICSDPEGTRSHYFQEPGLINVRSIAKPIACLALGVAIDRGLFFDGVGITLDTPIWPLLSTYSSVEDSRTRAAWERVVLRDLLRVTLGHDKGLMFSKDINGRDPNTLVQYVVNYPIPREVGKEFMYSNAGTFLLSTMVTEFLGIQLGQFVCEHLLWPLEINEFRWDRYGQYTAGCTGLWMYNKDLHKIGRLLLNDGNWNGRQIVPASFVQEMRSPQVTHPTHRYVASRAFPKWSYGLNLWICEDGNYYCDGTDGQYLIMLPERQRVVTALGFQPDTTPVSDALGLLK
jgi:CubicO group peptidase (beta-lactamase class C family)